MHATESYVKNAERCERLARESRGKESRAHFLDAAAYWRRMAVERQVTRQQEADALERGAVHHVAPAPGHPDADAGAAAGD